jgi:hypothetical protein
MTTRNRISQVADTLAPLLPSMLCRASANGHAVQVQPLNGHTAPAWHNDDVVSIGHNLYTVTGVVNVPSRSHWRAWLTPLAGRA